jgi:Flp pilus assembly protein TadD
VRAQQQRFAEAAGHFLRAIELKPDHADAYNGLGYVLAGQGRLEEAAQAFARVVQLNPSNPAGRTRLNAIQTELDRRKRQPGAHPAS